MFRSAVASMSVVLASSLVGSCAPAADEGGDATQRFVAMLGTDTVQVDEYTITEDRIEGRSLRRVGGVVIDEFEGDLDAEGRITRFALETRGLEADSASPPSVTWTLDYGSDSVSIERTSPQGTQEAQVSASGNPVPLISLFAPLHYDLAQRRVPAGDTAEVVFVSGTNLITMPVERPDPSTGVVQVLFGPVDLTIAEGRMVRADGSRTTVKYDYVSAPDLDLDALLERYRAAGAEAVALPSLSPPALVSAEIAGAEIQVNYSRPSRRGREIFGEIVPWDEVWRTGANAATTFTTSADLELGGTPVPAGSYTLWTLPRTDSWTLIVNSQTGQWGTAYDEAQDFARIPMMVETLPEAVEQFTITVEPASGSMADEGEDGVLSLSWANTRVYLPFRVGG